MPDAQDWTPDTGLVSAVHGRVIPISTLSGPDRSWVVAALTVQGWTVASIAARLKCSMRLVQQIKAEPMTMVALYALAREQELVAERGCRRVENLAAAAQLRAQDAQIQRLTHQRDTILEELMRRRGQS